MGRLLRNLFLVVIVVGVGVFAYYGTVDPCEILAEERKGRLVERLIGGDVRDDGWSSCAAELPSEWWEKVERLWSDRPAADR